jgi:hypothetical protein
MYVVVFYFKITRYLLGKNEEIYDRGKIKIQSSLSHVVPVIPSRKGILDSR